MGEMLISDVTFSYDGKHDIFEDLTCTIATDEVFCILGPNGIGKSTLLKAIMNLYPLKKGAIVLDGKDVRSYAPKELARKIAYIPQTYVLTFPYKVLDMIMMGRTPHLAGGGRLSSEDYDRAYEAASSLGLDKLLYRSCTELSGGQLQMVMLARAIAQEAVFLMMDEPTSHLDFGKQMETLNMVLQMKQKGMGILMTSHNPDHAFMVCDKVAIMNGGGFSAVGTPEEVITETNLKAIYSIDIDIVDFVPEEGRRICVPLRANLKY